MDLIQMQCAALKLPVPEKEVKFCLTRRWRADYFFPNVISGYPLAVEIEGGAFSRGRHTRGAGFLKDMEKYNMLSIMGIALLRFTPTQVQNGEAALKVKEWFDANRNRPVRG